MRRWWYGMENLFNKTRFYFLDPFFSAYKRQVIIPPPFAPHTFFSLQLSLLSASIISNYHPHLTSRIIEILLRRHQSRGNIFTLLVQILYGRYKKPHGASSTLSNLSNQLLTRWRHWQAETELLIHDCLEFTPLCQIFIAIYK